LASRSGETAEGRAMIQAQLKLRLTVRQEQQLEQWLFHLTAVWNWAIRKIELNTQNKIYFKKGEFQNLLAGHSDRLEIPSHTLQGMLCAAYDAWVRRFTRLGKRPRFKGARNRLKSVPFPDPIRNPKGTRIAVPGLGKVRFHKMDIPDGKIKAGRIIKRASGWYLCLFIEADPKPATRKACGEVGIDSGFSTLLTLSNGEVVDHPRELEGAAKRIAQAQRGRNKQLTARIHERISNQKKDRNHKLSHRLVSENIFIAFTKDNLCGMAKRFTRSIRSSSFGQLRQMLAYKSRAGGTQYVEVDSRNSTKTCSACGSLSGPVGLSGLKVRQWECKDCGAFHDRDINAARNTLKAGAGYAHEVSHA
jgi:putative transposase